MTKTLPVGIRYLAFLAYESPIGATSALLLVPARTLRAVIVAVFIDAYWTLFFDGDYFIAFAACRAIVCLRVAEELEGRFASMVFIGAGEAVKDMFVIKGDFDFGVVIC